MKKNTRTLLITVISFAVVIIIAAVAYNMVKDTAPAVSFTPTLAVAKQDPEPKKAEVAKPAADPQASAPTPVADQQAAVDAPAPASAQDEPKATPDTEEDKNPVMPNLPLTRLDGTMTAFHDVRDGKPAIINYFASWCPPCKQELPHFQKAFDEYGELISFIFLDALDGQRETLKTINAFIRDFPFTGPVFYDKGEFAMTFQTNSLPTTVFFDKEGRVVKGYLGFVPEDVLYADIAELLD
ncbi:MAG: redoxin domain-containing protein [Spirochaetia bacterium]|nr:redoxin domain-containing protein [Spirochaetia bacterium]